MKIVLSKRASIKLEKLISHLEVEWSENVKNNFIYKLDKALKVITTNPQSFPKSEKIVDLHKCVITKQTSVFYKFNKDTIFIVSIFDTRQNPKKLLKK